MRIEMRRDFARAQVFFANPRRSPDAVLPRGAWIPELIIHPGTEVHLSTVKGPARGVYLGHGPTHTLFLGTIDDFEAMEASTRWREVEAQAVQRVRIVRETRWATALLSGFALGGVSGLLSHSNNLGGIQRASIGAVLGLGLGTIAGWLYGIDPEYDFGGADRIRRIHIDPPPHPTGKSDFEQPSP